MDFMIFIHMIVPAFILALNLYIIMLEDSEEERFFKQSKKTGRVGRGALLVNFALVASVFSLAIAAYFKFVIGSKQIVGGNPVVYSSYDDEDEEDDMNLGSETVVFIEECLLHALAVI
jgi:hypothetical protein